MASKDFRPVEWIGSSYKDFVSFPDAVQDTMGHALYLAQTGRLHSSAQPLKGFGGAGVVELVEDFARFPEEVEKGDQDPARGNRIGTPPAKAGGGRRQSAQSRYTMSKKQDTTIRRGSKNVFADLRFPDADTHLLKAQ